MHKGSADIVSKITNEITIDFPCEVGCNLNLKHHIVKHYFVIRNYSVVNFSKFTKKSKTIYGSATKIWFLLFVKMLLKIHGKKYI